MAISPERPALEVFVNESGTITIRQDADGEEEPVVVVHPDDVSSVIRALEDARSKACGAAAEERQEVTVPAFVYPRRSSRSP
jgi:hypothetical protein